jgi:hypothetical protein
MNKTEQALRPCPCCGGKAEFDHDDDDYHWINCTICSLSTDTDRHDAEDCRDRLAEIWNRRTLSPSEAPAEQPEDERDRCIAWAEVHYRHAEEFTVHDLEIASAAWQAAKRDALTQAPQERAAVTNDQIIKLIRQHTGINQQQFPDQYRELRSLAEALISLAQSSEGERP